MRELDQFGDFFVLHFNWQSAYHDTGMICIYTIYVGGTCQIVSIRRGSMPYYLACSSDAYCMGEGQIPVLVITEGKMWATRWPQYAEDAGHNKRAFSAPAIDPVFSIYDIY